MAADTVSWYLEQEARGLLTRLALVRPFAVHETMVPAAAPSPVALASIETFLITGRRTLRERINEFLRWLRGPGRQAPVAVAQRRFTILRMDFNNVLTHFDLFTEVITQRSEHVTGVWLSGLDVLAKDTLTLPGGGLTAPPVVCYLARGPGAAIRRASTKLPGGAANPVATIRVPRERMVGHGIASSLVHECGHQAAALLSLVESLRIALTRPAGDPQAKLWNTWRGWISEIVADLWSVSKVGAGSTLGLMSVVGMPRWVVFRPSGADPHPIPWLRVQVSAEIGAQLYPHPQWANMTALWRTLYPMTGLTPEYAAWLTAMRAHIPVFVKALLAHRPAALKGRSLGQALVMPGRQPEQLLALWHKWKGQPRMLGAQPPSLVFAVIGQARAAGLITPERESRLIGAVLTQRALLSSLDLSQICALSSRKGVSDE